MPHGRQDRGTHILVIELCTAFSMRPDFSCKYKCLCCPRRCAHSEISFDLWIGQWTARVGGQDTSDGIVLYGCRHDHRSDRFLVGENRRPIQDSFDRNVHVRRGSIEDFAHFLAGRVTNHELEEESVQLCFGKRIGSPARPDSGSP